MRQNDLTPYFGVGAAICATLGGRKKDRGKATWHELGMNSWPAVFAMLLCNAILKLGPSIWHARPALREAADVLRTYRRAAGEKRKAEVNVGKAWALYV